MPWKSQLPENTLDLPELKRAWARARIDQLLDQSASNEALSHKIRQEVIGLALEYHLVTPFTAFTALDPEVVNPEGEMLAVAVAQPLPEGLDRAGFLPAPPVHMAQTMLPMPAMSRMVGAKRTNKNTSAHEKAIDSELYQKAISPMGEFDPEPGNYLASSPTINRSLNLAGSTEAGTPDAQEVLRWLARTQNLNGSWSEDVVFTSAALVAFVRQGNTTRRGYFRKQVNRAVEWLLGTTCNGTPAHLRAFALHELASTDPKLEKDSRISAIIDQLDTARTTLEQTIQTRIKNPATNISGPQEITDLESLRIAWVLNLNLEIPGNLLENDPENQVKVWTIGMTS